MFRYSWSQPLFLGETLETSLERLSRMGYAGVELPVLSMLPAEVKARLRAHGLACTSIVGRFIGLDRDLSSPDEARRAAAVAYVRTCLRFAAHVGAPVAILVPTRIGKLRPDTTLEEEWACVVRSLEEIGETGRELGVTAVIEAVNRAESYLCNRLETARCLVEAAGSDHIRVMADNFHMNIEEVDTLAALRDVAPWLAHVHLADNTRRAPGMGQADIHGFLKTLHAIGYAGPITMECDVQVTDHFGRAVISTAPADFDTYAETAITTLRRIETQLAANKAAA